MLLLALVAISLIKTSKCVKAIPGQPVPNADVLGNLMSKFLGDSYSNNALFDFILGQPSQSRDNLTEDNLDISILDVNNVRKIIAFAKKKYENGIMAAKKSRRSTNEFSNNEIYYVHEYIANKSLDLMKHSMYMTKEKINLTRPFRKRYVIESGYQIAILYGASAAILVKMEALYHQMRHFITQTHFIWSLIIYEKILACNIDINDSIEKIFLVHDAFAQNRGPQNASNSIKAQGNLTREQVKAMMFSNVTAQKTLGLLHKKRFQRK